jgi:purine-nucleoside phosphorylase
LGFGFALGLGFAAARLGADDVRARAAGSRASIASSLRLIARRSARIAFTSSWVTGSAPRTLLRRVSAPAPAPRKISSTASCARPRVSCADPTVAWSVRSTASRTASGTCCLGLLAIAFAVWHIVRRVTEPAPIHLKPQTELAARVLLPGDPHRALAVAQAVLESPRMFNHHRGLWGYSGTAEDGQLLSVQATGMGGPSAAIVIEELIMLGARSFIRIGTCGGLDPGLSIGELVTAERALSDDGASRALGAGDSVGSDPALTHALLGAGGGRAVTAVSTDLFFDPRRDRSGLWRERGASVVEMEAAALFQLATLHGVAAGCVLGVTDLLGGEGSRTRIDQEELAELGVRLGQVGAGALASVGAPTR